MEEGTQGKSEKWSWMDHKPDNMIAVNGSPDKNFFKWWCIIMSPFIDEPPTPTEADLVACFLKQRHELSQKILDQSLVDSQLMDHKTREKILEECGITLSHYYVLTGNLKKKGILTKNGINPKLIPRISKNNNGYCQLLLLFKDDIIK